MINFKEEIINMIQNMDNEDYLEKIYYYVGAKYHRNKPKKVFQNEQRNGTNNADWMRHRSEWKPTKIK